MNLFQVTKKQPSGGLTLKTASGDIASFEVGYSDPLPSPFNGIGCLCNINPVQDLHGEDRPYPAGGGVNLWDEETLNGYYVLETGVFASDPSRLCSKNPIPVNANTTYYAVAPYSTDYVFDVIYYDSSNGYLGYKTDRRERTFTTPNDCAYIQFSCWTVYGATYHNDISINNPSTDHDYHPYANICPINGYTEANITANGNTYTIVFGQTVYGGVLDVTRGKLVADCELLKATDDGSWRFDTSAGTYNYVYKNNLVTKNDLSKFKCNIMPVVNNNADIGITRSGGGFIQIYVNDLGVTNLTEWQQYINNNDVYILYSLTTPVEIDLTPVQIEALLGVNNVFSDTNGTTEVKYLDVV